MIKKVFFCIFCFSTLITFSQTVKEDSFCVRIRGLIKREFSNYEWITQRLTDPILISLSQPQNRKPYFFYLNTIVHEGYHICFGHIAGIYGKYWLSENKTYNTGFTQSFSAEKIDLIIPDSIKSELKNYNLYVKPDKSLLNSTKTIPFPNKYELSFKSDGIVSLLDELTAYYHSLKIYNQTYDYLNNNNLFKNDSVALNFLLESETVSNINYIEYYILKYIEYTKNTYPNLYQEITTNKPFIEMFKTVQAENSKTITNYFKYKEKVLLTNPKLKNKYNSFLINDPFIDSFMWELPDKSILFGEDLLTIELKKHIWIN